jgi:hypothetical protein
MTQQVERRKRELIRRMQYGNRLRPELPALPAGPKRFEARRRETLGGLIPETTGGISRSK